MKNARPGTLGTFAGVFTPSILTILGIILFLRLGFVVGSAGLWQALGIIGIATGISLLTSFALAAIATNIQVKGGGDYYLISRTLGVEYGGAIGIVLFLAQAVSIAFYCIGFGEASTLAIPGDALPARTVALGAIAVLGLVAWLGADWASRFQYGVMAILVAALASITLGGLLLWDPALLQRNTAPSPDAPPFWVVFAIFFPAVTGFTQGVSMSGDLRDPGRSIPIGTFLAIGVSTIVYVGLAILVAAALPNEALARDYGAMRRIARYAWLVDAGIMAATLSSGLASFLGAPRILQSMAGDRIFPVLQPFAIGAGPTNNPRRGVLLAGGIAVATTLFGNLNVIAPIVAMFFLTSYGLLNYATYYEARAKSPSFRPRLRFFDPRLCLVGFLGCLGAMLAINLTAGLVSVALLAAVYQYLRRTAGPARWADGSRSYHFQQVRDHLLAMAQDPEHPRDWRPKVLAFSNDPPRRTQLLRFASWIEGGSGLTTVVKIIETRREASRETRAAAEEELARDIAASRVPAFPLVIDAPEFGPAARVLVQATGLGPIRANIILLNWREERPAPDGGTPDDEAGRRAYARNLQLAVRLGCNVIVLAATGEAWKRLEALPVPERRVDIVWRNDPTSDLMLLLAHLMTQGQKPGAGSVRILAGSGSARGAEKKQDRLAERLEEVRIAADVEVTPNLDAEALAERSRDAALVMLPLRLTKSVPRDPFGGDIEKTLAALPVVALILAAEDIALDAGPDEGRAAELAAAQDAAADALRAADDAEREAAKLAEEATKAEEELESLGAPTPEEAESRAAATEVATARRRDAREAERQATAARAQAEAAARTAAELGAPTDPPVEPAAS